MSDLNKKIFYKNDCHCRLSDEFSLFSNGNLIFCLFKKISSTIKFLKKFKRIIKFAIWKLKAV